MAIPKSPSVVVLENDNSIYTPNVDSSIVGVVGFADKGPADTPTLITSQERLLDIFGRPSSDIPGQGIEGALEILEATNQLYFVRAINASAAQASATIQLGACPAVMFSAAPASFNTSGFNLSISAIDNLGTLQYTNSVTLVSSQETPTFSAALSASFNNIAVGDQPVMFFDIGGSSVLASRYAGANCVLQLSCASSLMSIIDLSGNPTGAGAATVAASGFSIAISSFAMTAKSIYKGTGYNLATLNDGSVRGLSLEIDSNSILDTFTVNSDGAAREYFNLNLIPSSVFFAETVLTTGENSESDLVEVAITESTLGSLFSEKLTTAVTLLNGSAATPRFVKPIEGTYAFTGGDSGYSTTEEGTTDDFAALIGTAEDKTGIQALNEDFLNISLALVPGISNQRVQNALITLAEQTKNFFALISPPMGYTTVQQAIDWMNGRKDRTVAVNTSWASVTWPWVQVFNPFAEADEWYDPAIFAARQCVYTDNVSEPWFAPAGFRRGRLTKPINVEIRLNQGDKDALYSNNINPVIRETQAGVTIFGQKTAQRFPSALDRINVRRLMIYIRKVLLELGKPFQFEPNDQFTWELVEEALKPFIDDLLARRAIVEGAVKCDSSTNTPIRVDRNELWCSVTIKPTKAAETIVFEVNLTNQSATVN